MIDKIKDYIKKMYNNDVIRYIFFGGLTTLVNLVSYFILRKINIQIFIANFISIALAIIFAYLTNSSFVFKSKKVTLKERLEEFTKFVSARILTMIIEIFGVYIFIFFNLNDMISKILIQFVVLILNYIFSKLLVFNSEKETILDRFLNFIKKHKYILISLLIGFVSFIILYGYHILNPKYTDWLLEGGDLSQHFLGWKFFRNSNWNILIGTFNNISYPNYSSIIFTDSIPLFAVIFKIFNPILPKYFQYFGLWGLMSFMLQSCISYLILKKLTKNDIYSLIGSVFFTISPIMIDRMFNHTALGGHWIILLPILFIVYYDDIFSNYKKSLIAWSSISILSSSIHIYFTAMNAIMLIGFLIIDYKNNKKINRLIFLLLFYIFLSLLTIYLLGGFMKSNSFGVSGLGYYSFNLNGFLNSMDHSVFLKQLDVFTGGQYEGFSYLGLGCILMFIYLVLNKISNIKTQFKLKKINIKIIAIIIVSILLILFAISNTITIGSNKLISYPIPNFIENIWSMFRSSGRFIWPVIYIIMFLLLYLLYNNNKNRSRYILILLFLIIQYIDLSAFLHEKHERFSNVVYYDSKISFNKWHKVINDNEIKNFVFASSFHLLDLYSLSNFAVDNNKTINKFYFAHGSGKKDISKNLKEALANPSDENLYIFYEKDKFLCTKFNLHYYLVDKYIIGSSKLLNLKEINYDDMYNLNINLTYEEEKEPSNKIIDINKDYNLVKGRYNIEILDDTNKHIDFYLNDKLIKNLNNIEVKKDSTLKITYKNIPDTNANINIAYIK